MIERLSMNSEYSALETAIHLNRYLSAKPYCAGKIILDISCGEGYGSRLLHDWGAKKVVGLDISEKTIENAKQNFGCDNLEYIVHDAMNLECFDDDTFDLVVSYETIEHLTNPLQFLKELKRVTKKDASLIISCPNDYLYYPIKKEKNPYHIKKYTYEEFKNIIESVFAKQNITYMLGTRAEGYMNTYMINEPNNLQINMIHEGKQVNTSKITPDIVIDENNACYYIAYINIKNIEENVVVFPNTLQKWTPNLINDSGIKEIGIKYENEYIKSNLNNKNNIITDLKRQTDDYKKRIKELEEQLENKDKTIELKDKELNTRNNKIDKLENIINKYKNDIEIKDKHIEELKEQIINKEQEHTKIVTDLANNIDTLARDLNDKTYQINTIYNSRTYKLSQIMRKSYNTIAIWRKDK